MGKKRKRDYTEEEIRKKIRKLNKRLEKRQRILSSSEDSDNIVDLIEPAPGSPLQQGDHSLEPEIEECPSLLEEVTPPLPLETRAVSEATPELSNEQDLDLDTLEMLGEAPEPEMTLGRPIHKDVATRWLDIVKKGLGKDIKEKLSKDYLIPGNCELLVPPLLNPEAKAALTEALVKRDSSLLYRQKQISNVLAALAPAVEVIISKDCDQALRQKVLKPINDACRILCDMHYNETKIRKKFVLSSISAGLKDTLVSSNTDKYLFGDDMSEKIKTAKNVQRSSEALKIPQKPSSSRAYSNKNRSNFKPLHQKMAGKQDAGRSQPVPRQLQYRPPAGPRRAPPLRDRSPQPLASSSPRFTRTARR